jgi:hypothetical protein
LCAHLVIILIKKFGSDFVFFSRINKRLATAISVFIIFIITVTILANAFFVIKGVMAQKNNLVLLSELILNTGREAIAQDETISIKKENQDQSAQGLQFVAIPNWVGELVQSVGINL